MENLSYICPWEKDRITSWSGSHNSLRNALLHDFNIHDIDTGIYSSDISVIAKGRIYTKKIVRKLLGSRDLALDRLTEINRIDYSNLDITFQFEEYPYIDNAKQYIYSDLSVLYIQNMIRTGNETLKYSGFYQVPSRIVDERANNQKKFYNHAIKIFTMSHWLRDYLINEEKIQSDKVVYAGGGSNLDISKISPNKQGNKILFVGKDFKRKNGPLVIDAFNIAKRMIPELELYIIGPKRIDNISNNIVFLGELSFEETVKYFNTCDVFCMPSLFEAYGLVFPEALMFGLPCIGMRRYEMPYFIEEHKSGLLLDDNNPETLATMMIELIKKEKYKNYVDSKRNYYINEYSWNSVGNRISRAIINDLSKNT